MWQLQSRNGVGFQLLPKVWAGNWGLVMDTVELENMIDALPKFVDGLPALWSIHCVGRSKNDGGLYFEVRVFCKQKEASTHSPEQGYGYGWHGKGLIATIKKAMSNERIGMIHFPDGEGN